jgi:hypothetical protein
MNISGELIIGLSTMTKRDQRDMTAKKFNDKIEKNTFLRQYYRARDRRVDGVALKKAAIVGFRRRPIEAMDTNIIEGEEGDLEYMTAELDLSL